MPNQLCPHCNEPLAEASGPETVNDVKKMIDNQLHIAGLCPGGWDKVMKAYRKLFGKEFGQ